MSQLECNFCTLKNLQILANTLRAEVVIEPIAIPAHMQSLELVMPMEPVAVKFRYPNRDLVWVADLMFVPPQCVCGGEVDEANRG